MKDLTFEEAYLNIIKEEGQQLIVADDKNDIEETAPIAEDPENPEEDTEDSENPEEDAEDSENQEAPEDNSDDQENTKEIEAPEDDMESAETNQEFEDDGWKGALGEQYNDVLDLSEKLEDFTYEIKNCQRGSFTNAKSKEKLADYMVSLAEELNSYAESLRG